MSLGNLESSEKLEQLRWIENGCTIKVAITDKESLAIDSPEDVTKVIEAIKSAKTETLK